MPPLTQCNERQEKSGRNNITVGQCLQNHEELESSFNDRLMHPDAQKTLFQDPSSYQLLDFCFLYKNIPGRFAHFQETKYDLFDSCTLLFSHVVNESFLFFVFNILTFVWLFMLPLSFCFGTVVYKWGVVTFNTADVWRLH